MTAPTVVAAPPRSRAGRRRVRLPRWVRLLATGAALWALAVGVQFATGDRYVAAAVVLGAFVVPVALSARLVDGDLLAGVGLHLVIRLFACGGLLGFLASAFLERPLVSQPAAVFDGWVGLVEETSKLALLALMTRGLAARTARSGFVLGGVIGFGFSAFESAGYALAASGDSATATIGTVLARAAATPFTHGLWTAIAGAALFASSRDGRLRITPLAVTALLGVAGAHACWDLMPNLAADLQARLTESSAGQGRAAAVTSDLLDVIGQAALSVPPLYVAYRLRRRRPNPGRAQTSPAPTAVGAVNPVERSAA